MGSTRTARTTAAARREQTRRELAAKRAAAASRRRLFVLAGSVGAVLAVVATLVAVKLVTGSGAPGSGPRAVTAPASVTSGIAEVPTSVLDQVGIGTVSALPTATSGPPLRTAGGTPRVLYIGAEYCPFCATERWPLAVALSRFGSFTGLGEVRSAPAPEVYPDTATLTFSRSAYHSPQLAFTAVETQSDQVVHGHYAPLQTPSPADTAVLRAHDSSGSIPFIDIGGRWVIVGASLDPQVLHGKSQAQIAAALADPSSPIARGVDGAANVITAGICQVTGNAPTGVCHAPGVRAAAARLGHGSG
jgi:hypothetical protein